MQAKAFELRDRGTFVPAVAIKLDPANEAEQYLIRRAGFHTLPSEFVLLTKIEGGKCSYDPHDWGINGTFLTAHPYIAAHFDELTPGQVICTEHLRGERAEPKTSERIENHYEPD